MSFKQTARPFFGQGILRVLAGVRHGALCALLGLFTALPLQAEDKLIDGIKFRLGMNTYSDDLKIDGIGNIAQKNKYINSKLVFKEEIFSGSLGNYQRGDEAQGYLVITLPEDRIGTFMFKGWNIDWIFNGKVQNLPPAEGSNQTVTVSGETLLRQDDAMITKLTSSFFNVKDRAFTLVNPDYWALSADITKNALLLGYSYGVFLPIGDQHRFFKVSYGLGLGVYQYVVDLNLCEKYTLTQVLYDSQERKNYYEGNCVGKVQIDEATLTGVYGSVFQSTVFWERVTRNSIMTLLTLETSQGFGIGVSDAKTHDKTVSTNVLFDRIEFFSYTYRFK